MALKVLITGATGYIGGSVLTKLLDSSKGSEPAVEFSVLIRGPDRVKVYESKGVKALIFDNLDQSELLRKVASDHEIIINTASSFHTESAKAFILGLADRAKNSAAKVHYIHTSGTSNLSDQPITGKYHESRIFSDEEDIYAYEQSREALQVYAQRATDLAVVATGLANGVKTTILMSPTIYGIGSGFFNKLSIQIPTLIRAAIKDGHSSVIGDGAGVWDYIHIADLADLYEVIFSKVVSGEDVPTGEKGILFTSAGRFSWLEIAQNIASALIELGAFKTDEITKIGLAEAAEKWTGGRVLTAELGLAANSRTDSVVAKKLGWKPKKTELDFKNSFLEEARIILQEQNKQL